MGGGSYDYISHKIDDLVDNMKTRHPNSKEHIRLIKLLRGLSVVLHEVEWADSGDSDPEDAIESINKFFNKFKYSDTSSEEILDKIRKLLK